MQVPQTVQMTYWSHQHFFGSHHSRQIPPSSEGKTRKKSTFSSLHHSFSLLFSGEHKSVWCLFFMDLGAPATSIWPINHVVVSSNHDTTLSSRIIEVEIGFLPPQSPSKKNTKVSFYSIDPCSTSMIFWGKKYGGFKFHLIRFDQTKPLQPPDSWTQLFVRLAGQTWGRHSAVAF